MSLERLSSFLLSRGSNLQAFGMLAVNSCQRSWNLLILFASLSELRASSLARDGFTLFKSLMVLSACWSSSLSTLSLILGGVGDLQNSKYSRSDLTLNSQSSYIAALSDAISHRERHLNSYGQKGAPSISPHLQRIGVYHFGFM